MLLLGQMAKVRSPRWFAYSLIFTWIFEVKMRSKSQGKCDQGHKDNVIDNILIFPFGHKAKQAKSQAQGQGET